jgi:AraC-like DNA-binding protein
MATVPPSTDARSASRLKSLLDHLDLDHQVVGQDLRPHDLIYPPATANFSKIFCITGGRGEHVAGGKTHAVSHGDLVFVPAGIEAVDNPVGRTIYAKIFCHFRAHSAGLDLSAFLDLPPVIRPERNIFSTLKRNFTELLQYHHGTATTDGLHAHAMLRTILAHVIASTPPQSLKFRWSESLTKLDQVIARMSADLKHDHRLEELAKSIAVHPNHLCRLFTRSVGQPPHQFLKNLRLTRAQDLLQSTDLTIDTIASDSGFANAQHFTRAFSERFGMPPAQFRKSAPS